MAPFRPYSHTKVSENCLHLKRKFPHSLATVAKVKRQKKRKIENAYKVKTRRGKRLNMKCAELFRVLSPNASFSEIENGQNKITAQDILIADVGILNIRSH